VFVESGYSFFTHADYFQYGPYDGKALYLRHDADRNIEIALVMARIENELGIKATYYLLPPGDYGQEENYYGAIIGSQLVPSNRLKEVVLEMASMGHEIGLHNDFVQLSVKLGRDVEDVISEQIEYFKNIGIRIIGTASHGSEFVKTHGFVNYQIFSECKQAKSVARMLSLPEGRSFELFSIAYKQLGLEYEAYSIKRDCYISDSSGIFSVNKAEIEAVNLLHLKEGIADAKAVVALLHPDWWTVQAPAKKNLIKAFADMADKFFPSGQKIKKLQEQVATLRQNNEALVHSWLVSEKERKTLRGKLDEQKEKSRALYARNKEYADRLNKKTIL